MGENLQLFNSFQIFATLSKSDDPDQGVISFTLAKHPNKYSRILHSKTEEDTQRITECTN